MACVMELLLGETTMAKSQETGKISAGSGRPAVMITTGAPCPAREHASEVMLLPDRRSFKTRLRDPAARNARVLQRPSAQRGRGECRVPAHPQPRVVCSKHAR